MNWKKLGNVFCPIAINEWMHSHAANPVVDHLHDDLFRIYFSTRDADKRSSIAWVEIDINNPLAILNIAENPVLKPGLTGCFDDSGCSIGSIVRIGSMRYLFYMGWNLGVTVPWRNAIGLAISKDGGQTYERISLAPIMDRSDADPYTLSYPWVIHDNGEWRMWYGSNLTWGKAQADMYHMIKMATSLDGYQWQRDGKVVIEPDSSNEFAFARPCVIKIADGYRMWYAYRGSAYSIGYAESIDGQAWIRKDNEVGIATSAGQWDGECIEYPCVFDHKGVRYMLYCGNNYGQSGFGIAVMDNNEY